LNLIGSTWSGKRKGTKLAHRVQRRRF
jgi:hypothetical protein